MCHEDADILHGPHFAACALVLGQQDQVSDGWKELGGKYHISEVESLRDRLRASRMAQGALMNGPGPKVAESVALLESQLKAPGFPAKKWGWASDPPAELLVASQKESKHLTAQEKIELVRFASRTLDAIHSGRSTGLKTPASWGVALRAIAHQLSATGGLRHVTQVCEEEGCEYRQLQIWKSRGRSSSNPPKSPGRPAGSEERPYQPRTPPRSGADAARASNAPNPFTPPRRSTSTEFRTPESRSGTGLGWFPAVPAFPFASSLATVQTKAGRVLANVTSIVPKEGRRGSRRRRPRVGGIPWV
jgi:hypothetical protein